MTSAVIITPAAMKPQATAFAVQMGWQEEGADPGTFGVPLMTGGVVTHWGTRADVFQGFHDLMADPPKEALPLLTNLIIDLSEELWGREHWEKVIKEHDLKDVPPSEI